MGILPEELGPSIFVLIPKRRWHQRCFDALCDRNRKEISMLRAAIIFFVIGLVAMLCGATGFAGVSMEIGRLLLFVFLFLAVVSFVVSLISGRGGKNIP
jgi:uncharacterized membrane protein YtjA (UPF0391 family)